MSMRARGPCDSAGGRVTSQNPDHHLWCNNGIYYIHVTVIDPDGRKLRFRRSLETKDLQEARCRRDRFLGNVRGMRGFVLLLRCRRSAPRRSA